MELTGWSAIVLIAVDDGERRVEEALDGDRAACVQSGLQARAVEWLVMSRGMHRETRNEDGEYVGASTDEAPQRAAYREWRRLMAADGPQLPRV